MERGREERQRNIADKETERKTDGRDDNETLQD